MGKRETKDTYKESRQAAQEVPGQYTPLITESQSRATALNPGIAEQREFITGGLKSMMGPAAQMSARTIGGVGSIDVSDLKNSIEGYKGFRDTGGLSAENVERMRGMGGFDEFAKTGGYTPESIANIKAQAISPIGSFATGTRDELARRQALQSGYAPGFDAANRALQRDTARAIADTSLNANVAIQDRVNQGRQWGISGLTGAEQALAGMQTGNRLAALGGETTAGQAISEADARNMANQLAVQQFNAQQEAMAQQFNIMNQEQQYAQGLSGLSGLYGQDVGLQQGEYDRQLAINNAMNQARSGYLGTQGQLAAQPGIGGNIMGAVGAGAGVLGNWLGAPRILNQ